MISEAVLVLRNSKNTGWPGIQRSVTMNAFVRVPRDIVARAINNELKMRREDYVSGLLRSPDEAEFVQHFPNI
ncbi:MAG: hypothetical protein IPM92_16985 [Saprospiraceae bacterium]|nr:hypothetical protein [Saprospiraceae bacterium]